jgi:hypothetical protein
MKGLEPSTFCMANGGERSASTTKGLQIVRFARLCGTPDFRFRPSVSGWFSCRNRRRNARVGLLGRLPDHPAPALHDRVETAASPRPRLHRHDGPAPSGRHPHGARRAARRHQPAAAIARATDHLRAVARDPRDEPVAGAVVRRTVAGRRRTQALRSLWGRLYGARSCRRRRPRRRGEVPAGDLVRRPPGGAPRTSRRDVRSFGKRTRAGVRESSTRRRRSSRRRGS